MSRRSRPCLFSAASPGHREDAAPAAPTLAVVGGTVVDLIFPGVPRLPRWPHHQESTPENLVRVGAAPVVTLGGNGANAAYVAARCGATVTLHTEIAGDPLGELARRWLEQAGCTLDVGRGGDRTAVNVVAANDRLERAMLFYPGAAPTLPSFGATGPAPSLVLVAGWPHPPLDRLARTFRRLAQRGSFTALDMGPLLERPWTLPQLAPVLGSLDLLLTNDFELQRITGARLVDPAIARLRKYFSGHVVIKCGAQGALWLPAGSEAVVPVPVRAVAAVNTVGAGDSFNGALLAALARGAGFPTAVRLGCRAAASVVRSARGVLGVVPAVFSLPAQKSAA